MGIMVKSTNFVFGYFKLYADFCIVWRNSGGRVVVSHAGAVGLNVSMGAKFQSSG